MQFVHVNLSDLLQTITGHESVQLVSKLAPLALVLLLEAEHNQIVALRVRDQLLKWNVLPLTSHVPGDAQNFDIFKLFLLHFHHQMWLQCCWMVGFAE